MRIQPISYSYNPSVVYNNNRLNFKAQENPQDDRFEPEEKPLSAKEENDLIMKNYYKDLLIGMGFYPKTLPSGNFRIQNYKSSDVQPSLKMFGVKEENLFKYIEEIPGQADFKKSEMKNLGVLKKAGNLCLQKSNIENLSGLEEVFGNMYLNGKVKHIEHIKIGGVVHLGIDSRVSTARLEDHGIVYYRHNYPLK